jgi:hypothetical protein
MATAVAPWGLSSCPWENASHGDLGEVVEHRDPIVSGVVLEGAVGHLDE